MENPEQIRKPFILRLTSIIALTYHLVFLIIFLIGVFFNGFLSKALENYFPVGIEQKQLLFFSIFGALIYSLSVTGLIYIRRLKKIGLLMFSISISAFFILKMIIWNISLLNLLINIAFIIIFTTYIKRFK
jgi:hypothetical protein